MRTFEVGPPDFPNATPVRLPFSLAVAAAAAVAVSATAAAAMRDEVACNERATSKTMFFDCFES